jgi:hypothetical protein
LTTDQAAVAASRPLHWTPHGRPLLTTPARRAVAVALALVPAVIATLLAIVSPAPLSVTGRAATVNGGYLLSLQVEVVNHTGVAARPNFFVDVRSHISRQYRVTRGPTTVGAHQQATVTLVPVAGPVAVQAQWSIVAFSADPDAMSSGQLRLQPSQIHVKQVQQDPDRAFTQRCAVRMLEGGDGSCLTAPRVPAKARAPG